MTKDYKNVSASRAAKSSPKVSKKKVTKVTNKTLPPWLWMLSGLIIGGFISFLVFLKMKVPSAESHIPEKIAKVADKAKTEVKAVPQEGTKEDRFKFYSILPTREVTVPAAENPESAIKKSSPKDEGAVTKSKSSSYQYVLQAGSFARFQDADRRKANLAFMGVISKIHAVEANNKTFYRVRIGPYEDMAQVNEIEAILKQNKIMSLRIKVKG